VPRAKTLASIELIMPDGRKIRLKIHDRATLDAIVSNLLGASQHVSVSEVRGRGRPRKTVTVGGLGAREGAEEPEERPEGRIGIPVARIVPQDVPGGDSDQAGDGDVPSFVKDNPWLSVLASRGRART